MLEGHEEPEDAFRADFASRRLHHGWLLAGPRGLGKRHFAEWAARLLLGGEGETARLIEARSHPDLRLLQVEPDEKGKERQVIVVDQVRELGRFLAGAPAYGGYRVVIVDAADDLNPNAANALLKMLEEPGARTVFLMVAHAASRLLPTIRSRCRLLRFRPLADARVDAVLRARFPDLDDAARAAIVGVARGSPGEAVTLVEEEAYLLVERLASEAPAALARGFQGAATAGRFAALCSVAPRLAANRGRAAPGEGTLAAYDRVAALAVEARVPGHDRMLLAAGIASALAGGQRRRP
jgi:DNA polymerase-3 subunit delta'